MAGQGRGSDGDRQADRAAHERAIAELATDAYWSLDERFRYRHHAGDATLVHPEAPPLLGHSRLELFDDSAPPADDLQTHHRLMRAHREMDMLIAIVRPDRARRCVRVVATPRFGSDGRFIGYLGYERDVTDFVSVREKFQSIALRDELTGLHNRYAFRQRIDALRQRVASEGSEHMLCLLDLDRFKLINDTAGHAAGDRLLQELSTIMRDAVTPLETLARLGGDEFALLLDGAESTCSARMERLVRRIAAHEFVWSERPHGVGASIGMAAVDAGDVQHVIDLADSACYAAKDAGRNRCVVFTLDSVAYRRHRNELDKLEAIRSALRAQRLALRLQRIEPARPAAPRDTADPATAWHEASARLMLADGRSMAPEVFIPVAERFGLMPELDLWTLQRTLEVLDRQPNEHRLSVDLSANTLGDEALQARVLDLIRSRSLAPGALCLELGESTTIANIGTTSGFMRELHRLGVRVMLDHVGIGVSSLCHLSRLPIDALKLDDSVCRRALEESGDAAVVRALLGLARALQLPTVATGVDDRRAAEMLGAAGFDYLQGSAIAPPVDEAVGTASMPLPVRQGRMAASG